MTTTDDLDDTPATAPAQRVVEVDAATVELAREAAALDAGTATLIGDYLTADTEDDVAVTLRFATTDPAYLGWSWCVTVALVEPTQPTVSEVVLLPGPDALLPPRWLPWSERVRPGDLGPGDLLLPDTDDARLVPAYLESDDPAVEDVAHELGIGRVRVMSRAGRTDTAERWREGDFGPDSDMAKAAPLTCVMCAFFLPLAGSLSAEFGACGNEMSPADGRVVDSRYGCGAHSELVVEPVPTGFRESHIDDTVLDVHPRLSGQSDGPAEFLAEESAELEFEPVHPDAAEAAADGAALDLEDAPVEAAPVESAPLDADAPDLEDAPVDGAPLDADAPDLEDAPVDAALVEGAPLDAAPLDAEAPDLEDAPVEAAPVAPEGSEDSDV